VTVAFVLLAPFVERAGFPPIAALLAAILIVLVPFELAVIVRASRYRAQGFRSAIPYRRTLPLRDWVWLVPVLIVAAFIGFGLSMVFEPTVIAGFFAWLPDWFMRPIDLERAGDYSRDAWLVTLVAYLALNGFVGPIVEELYFRGYLLPRMEWMGRWAPLVNVSLFSLYHFLVAVAGAREDLGFRPDCLRRALEGERIPRHGRPLLSEHARHHSGHGHGAGPPLTRHHVS
jgi:membrane protease YdiL (CAAX protease family)